MAPTTTDAWTSKFKQVSPDDEICITGVSGYFPQSDSVKELQENLFDKMDLITDDDRRWKLSDPTIPQRTGKINNIDKFDASFFNVHYRRAHVMDPMLRLMLEKVYECIIDAGYNPAEMRNIRTGVIAGTCVSESEKMLHYDQMEVNEIGLVGCSRSMIANNISDWLGVTGPSYVVDTACSSSLYAMEHAVKSIRNGLCDAALVCGASLCLHPLVSQKFAKLGVLSEDGKCKCFDNNADGYTRSETVAAIFLQKAKDARRVYANVVHAKTNCDGYKEQGITYPAGHIQRQLLEVFYEECGISPSSLEYVEAHGTGTKVGDPEELQAIDDVFCTGRTTPLLIGSVKSNLGHTEGCSGVCSVTKLIIAYNSGYIPPNINYSSPREGVAGFSKGSFEVVTEKRPWNRGMAAASSFGFGGANAHVLLKNIARDKVNGGLPSDDLPRLVCVSGRTKASVDKILHSLESKAVDAEEVRLWHAIHEHDINGHPFRGYTILASTPTKSVTLARDIQRVPELQRPVWFVYPGLASQWPTTINELMKVPVFAAAIQKCHKTLKTKGFDLIEHLSVPKPLEPKPNTLENPLHTVISVTAIQIGLTDVLDSVGIKADHIFGLDIGELGCAYADGCLTAEQAIKAAYHMALAIDKAKFNDGSTSWISESAAVKLLKLLKDVITSPKPHSKRCNNWKGELASAEHFVNILLKPTHLEDKYRLVHPNAIIIDITQKQEDASYNDTMDVTTVSLSHKNEDSLQFLFKALGKLFEVGLNPSLANIYPRVPFPVSQGTSMLSHLVEWDHSETWFTAKYDFAVEIDTSERRLSINIEDDDKEYLTGHVIDGRILYPATGYLVLAWEVFALTKGQKFTEVSVVFENVCFNRATTIPKNGCLNFCVSVHNGNGHFEIEESGVAVVTGRIYMKKDIGANYRVIPEAALADNESKINLSSKDFYKELNLRGYQYKGLFRGVLGCNVEGTRGRIRWSDNWVTFLDSILQPTIVMHDTRALYVPTRIEKLSIDVDIHASMVKKMKSCEFRSYPNIQVTRISGIELRGLHVASISKKPPLGIPVYEKNQYVPNFCDYTMTLNDILRIDLQIIFENLQTYKFKCIEYVDEEYNNNEFKPIIEGVGEVLADLPLVQADLLIISEQAIDVPSNVTLVNKKLSGESNTVAFIGANLLERNQLLADATATLKDKCFVISREKHRPKLENVSNLYDIVTKHNTGSEYIVLLRKKLKYRATKFVKIVTSDETFSWIDKVKEAIEENQKLVLYSQGEKINGLLGLVNCLRREPGGETVYGLLISDPTAPQFKPELKIYKDHLDKSLALNVFEDGQWGTYRHLLLEDPDSILAPHAYVNTATVGDLSSLKWFQGPYTSDEIFKESTHILVHVYCSSLNFRDVMTAMGRVTLDAVARGRLAQECVQGLEISGRTANGSRVMGVCDKGISNLVRCEKSLMWNIPEEWSLEEAATVPVAYCTVYMALVLIGKIRPGESILIHAGSGGVGQAAISVALHYGLEVFTTVGTQAKRDIIKKLFPELNDNHIGNSRDTSFKEMIERETNGKGVDVVLNSLADDKLQASVKCLARRGRFLEIGKYDITNNSPIQTYVFKKEISFHGVMLDFISDLQSHRLRMNLQQLILTGITSGAVRPLTYCTFDKHEIESAYRYMAAGKHIGKVIIKIRDEESGSRPVVPSPILIDAVQRYSCNESHVYVLLGGLGGFGLELADWLILRGARKIVLTSRTGISNGYQAFRIRTWYAYGVNIQISTHDITTESGCEEMLKMANSMGLVEAVFNLAVILKDAVFQNQTPETFKASFGPKALATLHLDKLTRKLCPGLKDFVIFSSVSCGRGNAGQTNYGFSNSVMERICEERKRAGFPALAIQWGAVGDVGLVADMQEENIQLEIGGTLQQRITSCLQSMDKFLKQDVTIVSSIVVAEKRAGGSKSGSCVDAIAQIMSIKDLKTVSRQAPLAELGMDSIMAVEIKQTLERDFEIFLSAQEIRMLTFAKLLELGVQRESPIVTSTPKVVNKEPSGLDIFLSKFGEEKAFLEPFIFFPTMTTDGTQKNASRQYTETLFILPGIDSCAAGLKSLCSRLNTNACVMQLGLDYINEDLPQMADRLYETIRSQLPPGVPYYLLGYSFGTLPILKVAAKLESEGRKGVVFCIDGAADLLHAIATNLFACTKDSALQDSLICHIIDRTSTNNDLAAVSERLSKIDSFDDKINRAIEMCPVNTDVKYSKGFIVAMTKAVFNRIKVLLSLGEHLKQESVQKLKSPIVLLRPKLMPHLVECAENYGLDKFSEHAVAVHYFDANHVSIVDDEECANVINKVLSEIRSSLASKT